MNECKDVCQEYLIILGANGCISAINKHTRVQEESQSCIDHIFVKKSVPLEHFNSVILTTELTDHFSVILQWISPKPESEKRPTYKEYIEYKTLVEILEKETW